MDYSEIDFPIISDNNIAVKKYEESAIDMLMLAYPRLSRTEIEYVVQKSIAENIQYVPAIIRNSYKKQNVNTNLTELANYILSRQPIMTTYGVLFAKHGDIPHPLYKMVDGFINQRDVMKKKMFTYPKGSFDFEKYNLLQLLYKLDANAFYGAIGMSSCFYYNFYTAAAITAQGKSLNSAMALHFEMFLANNVPFESLNELVQFIKNTLDDGCNMHDGFLDHQALLEETFFKVMTSCGFNYIPSEKDMEIVWNMMSQLGQAELNRLYYRNNLYEFCSNQYVINLIVAILCKLESQWGDSTKVPDEVKPEVAQLLELFREYVFYGHQIIDRTDKMDRLIRSVSIIQDTDSAIVSYDAFYRFVLPYTRGIDMKIKNTQYSYIDEKEEPITDVLQDYNFETDEIIELRRQRDMSVIIPEDQLRHSILSIIGYCISELLNDYMYEYTKNSQAFVPANDRYPLPKGFKCLIKAKTEFLFKRILLTDAKKHYASYQELQEGNEVPINKALDTKGMDAFNKSTSNDAIKAHLKKILFDDIMNTPVIDQVRVIKSLAMVEKEIFNSITNGEKKFYKPAKVKSVSAYADPMRIQGVKASLAYNALHQDGTEALDMNTRNTIDIAKVEITPKNIERIKDEFPDVYVKAMALMTENKAFATGIDAIGIPANEPVPQWMLPFVRYEEIISDNVGNFPLESIGLKRGNTNNNKSNLVRF